MKKQLLSIAKFPSIRGVRGVSFFKKGSTFGTFAPSLFPLLWRGQVRRLSLLLASAAFTINAFAQTN